MRYFQIIAFLLVAIVVFSGCNGNKKLPDVSEIESIHLSLNDPDQGSYWNYEGNVPKKHWPKLLSHLTPARYKGGLAKWEGLGLIKIHPKKDAVIDIEVYLTRDSAGCYEKHGGYFTIDDEVAFYEDAKGFLQSDSDEAKD